MKLISISCNFFALMFLMQAMNLHAQNPSWSASEIQLEIEKLTSSHSVLYIAAHPDDENTRLITWLANEKTVRTGYLSLTRGDGGQNLVGEEQGAYLGVIRTQELLAARRMDGGEQFFTRAVDFGYSKSASETFTKWPHDSLLADVVWVIRNFQPDVIITRFPTDERAGHGHHTASAMLAEEAFDAAADPKKFPDQLKYVSVWQAKRLFWNNSTWWDKQLPEKIAKADPTLAVIDVGGYNAFLGKSYGEIAAESRTNHKSQGFGSAPTRGEQKEYLELKKGEAFSNNDIFSGLPIDWSVYENKVSALALASSAFQNFDAKHPDRSIPILIDYIKTLETFPQDPIVKRRIQQAQQIIGACIGLFLEPAATTEKVAAGESLTIVSTAVKRLDYPITLESIEILGKTYKEGEILPTNINQIDTIIFEVPEGITSSPYWLENDYNTLFDVRDRSLIGKAENDPAISVIYHVKIGDRSFAFKRGVIYKETDAVKGEIIQPLTVLPKALIRANKSLLMFRDNEPLFVDVIVESNIKDLDGFVFVSNDEGFIVSGGREIRTLQAGQTIAVQFSIQAPTNSKVETGNLKLYFIPGKNAKAIYDSLIHSGVYHAVENYIVGSKKGVYRDLQTISYDHIPIQQILEHAEVRMVRIQSPVPTFPVAYIEGAGDKVDESLRAFGVQVTTINPEDITQALLQQFPVVIIGVRAYNTSKAMAEKQALLMDYVQAGGTLITQYSTNWDSYVDQLGPYPFKLTRNRVTDEQSPVSFLLPDNPALNTPNKITENDFKGWVQERGIYFVGEADSSYAFPLGLTDPGEKEQNGALMVAHYGNGVFIYTGLVFFRELPAGVPGAYRLFVNLMSMRGKSQPK